jgi:cell division protein FtsN
MAAPRGRRPAAPGSGSRLASFLFGVGCLVVLAVTFTSGVAAGRRWPNGFPLPGLGSPTAATASPPAATAPARPEREAPRRAERRGFDKGKTTETAAPVLTYYHELTAPLPSTPPPARGAAKPETKPAETTRPTPVVTAAATRPTPVVAAAAVASTGEVRFTVQVGAFTVRSQAEALRARLVDGGQEAYVTEGEAGGVTQYRVRVGAFTTREAAREAAARLANERRLATYVTTR